MIRPMHLSKLLKMAAACLVLTTPGSLLAKNAGHLASPSFGDVRHLFDQVAQKYSARKVLVVIDIDNTSMAMPTDLGSEYWWLWQKQLIEAGDFTTGAIAYKLESLNALSRWIATVSSMVPVEPRIPQDVAELAKQGVSFIALTSRGSDIREQTLRELSKNGLNYRDTAPGPKGGYRGQYMPYDSQNPAAYGLTAEDFEKFPLSTPRTVTFEDGAMLTAGQHKGTMLKTLLAKTGATFDAIIFVDDSAHHLEGMQASFSARPENVYTVNYEYRREHTAKFIASNKDEVKAEWCAFSHEHEEILSKISSFIACSAP